MATLLLEDGTILKGKNFGAEGTKIGEIVFNTSMNGYQETVSDPSYANQIITMTYPEIGNYGLNEEDFESKKPECLGFVVKNYCKNESHYQSTKKLGEYFKENGVIAIEGIDTRTLTRKIRDMGTMKCLITSENLKEHELSENFAKIAMYKFNPDVVKTVTAKENYKYNNEGEINIALLDYGCKSGIMKNLAIRGCNVSVFKADTKAEEILNGGFDCVFLSNGPGDPSDCHDEIETIKNLIGKISIFAICLGYQLLGIVLGAKTYKLKYGHRGGNHPVINLETNKIIITSQNHGYAIDEKTLTGLMSATYKNLNDGTLEGFKSERLKIYAVQFHPEAAAGPTDASIIFDEWVEIMKKEKANAKN